MCVDPVWLGPLLEQVVPEVLRGTDGQPVRPQSAVPGSPAGQPAGTAAQVLLHLAGGATLQVGLQLSPVLARRLARAAGEGVTAADIAAEWVNLAGGRLAMRLAEAGVRGRLDLPAAAAPTGHAAAPAWALRRLWTCDGLPLVTVVEAFNA
ncbi:MAG: hypothetical protein RL026_2057 [Pseudomonadota bacterium]|jgi:hypothetical protein